ncbi:hypothetical protein PpBr36_07372 [Pyricularia pennisetigena]|uniref:hypothetical protein n=1 Tax=Pyricularia pennisetigena TaxID=1578925 RepID=UPI00114E1162|nr:hypothetical protein PpBr36_07372 [Pyricularia pennisetigena]TLS25936.1 hypothetical protein PpBr36_07372 [Pyricularia pennisetigena]
MDDFDIEMGDVETFPTSAYDADDILQVDDDILSADDAQEPGEVDESPNAATQGADDNTVIPTKVHLRGLDTMSPEDIKSYFNQHAGGMRYDRVEWIDDTSANLLFSSESAAAEALVFLSAIEITNPSALPPRELLSAKPYTAKPDVVLQVRFAVASDRKVAGAAARSRFYLLNPEYERPERNQRRGGHRGGNRYRDRDDYDRRYYHRNGGGRHDERYEYDDEDAAPFDVNLYDDDESSLAKRKPRARRSRSRSRSRPRSGGSGSDGSRRPDNSGKELFPDLGKKKERRGGVRNRSASPARSDRDGDVSMDGERTRSSAVRNRDKAHQIKELFPNKLTSGGKVAQMDQVDKVDSVSKRLSDRITTRPQPVTGGTTGSGDTLNIRGISRSQGGDAGTGISIKGRATAKELFPEKLGNAGKELFADKLEGRGRPRRKAEDSFY